MDSDSDVEEAVREWVQSDVSPEMQAKTFYAHHKYAARNRSTGWSSGIGLSPWITCLERFRRVEDGQLMVQVDLHMPIQSGNAQTLRGTYPIRFSRDYEEWIMITNHNAYFQAGISPVQCDHQFPFHGWAFLATSNLTLPKVLRKLEQRRRDVACALGIRPDGTQHTGSGGGSINHTPSDVVLLMYRLWLQSEQRPHAEACFQLLLS